MRYREPRTLNRNLILAAIAAGLVAACQEPNAVPAQDATAATAPTVSVPVAAAAPAAMPAGQFPKELSAAAATAELKPDALCNLERIDNQLLGSSEPYTPADSHRAVLTGWLGDGSTKSLPSGPVLMFRMVGVSRVWETPLNLSVPRDDVVKATGAAGLKMSGFSLDADLSALPVGSYRMVLVYDREGARYACDNGRDLAIGK